MDQYDWVVINYTLPREPSRVRVSIWRRLKKIGAVNMQQSMWLLPLTGEHFEQMNAIKDDVVRNGGEAFVMKSHVDEEGKAAIIERFNAARNEEYGELLEQCEEFYKEMDRETERKNFSFAEIEENEEELNKLKEWFGKISARDCFGAASKDESVEALLKCEELFEKFCSAVYAYHEGL
jgi:hypothetical protein